jgi:hypothetical protein
MRLNDDDKVASVALVGESEIEGEISAPESPDK